MPNNRQLANTDFRKGNYGQPAQYVPVNQRPLVHRQSEAKRLKNLKKKVDFSIWITFRYLFAIVFWIMVIFFAILFIKDAHGKIQTEIEKKRLETEVCQMEFRQNNCEDPLPALRTYCLEREKCLTTDPKLSVTRVRQVALVIAETINAAISHCELRTLIFIGGMVMAYLFMSMCTTERKRKNK